MRREDVSAEPPPKSQAAPGKPPPEWLIATSNFVTNLIHVMPIGIVQFADFFTDGARTAQPGAAARHHTTCRLTHTPCARTAFVIKNFFDSGDELSGTIGLAFMATSVGVVVLVGLVLLCFGIFLDHGCCGHIDAYIVGWNRSRSASRTSVRNVVLSVWNGAVPPQ